MKSISFLLKTEQEFCDIQLARAQEWMAVEEIYNGDVSNSWLGSLPWYGLYHSMMVCHVLDAYRKSHDWSNHEETNARNAATHPKLWKELCSLVYNNAAYEFTTNIYNELHDKFRDPTYFHKKACLTVYSW